MTLSDRRLCTPLPLFRPILTVFLFLLLPILGPTSPIGAQEMAEIPTVRRITPDGREVLQLDLETALRFALDRSWRVERSRLELLRDQYNLQASRAALKSNAKLSFTLPDFDQSIKEITDPSTGDPIILSTKGARYSTTLSIRQPLPTDGVVSLNGVLNRTQDDLIKYTPDKKTYYARTFVKFDQPILQPNRIQMDIRRAELQLEETELGARDEQFRIVSEVSRSYFDLFDWTVQADLAEQRQERMERIYTTGQRLLEEGVLAEVSMLQLEVERGAALDRASTATGRLAREKEDFKQQIGLSLDDLIELDSAIDWEPASIDEQAVLSRALAERSDLLRTYMRRERQEMDIRERRAEGSLTGSVSLTLGLEGRGGHMDDFYDALGDPDQARGAAINFSLPLWDWGRNRARILSKQTEIDQNYLTEGETMRTIQREVAGVVDRVREAEERLDVLQRSTEAAQRSFQLTFEQFEAGEIGVQDLLLTENRFAEARSSYLRAYLDYRRALIDLDGVTVSGGYGRSRF